jgi:3-phosphoglycerate kinase
MKIKSLKDIKKLSGKRVLVRVDFNVPLKAGRIKEIYKIEKGLPTIRHLRQAGAKVIIVSHLGRPEGRDAKLSLKPVAAELKKLLGCAVGFLDISDKTVNDKKTLENLLKKIASLKNGSVTLLENVRFIKGEETNDPKTAKMLASLADIFVLDGFAVAHRPAASVSGVAKLLPAYAGLLMEEEIAGLSRLLEKPKKPLVVILGGVKMETKIPLINKFLPKAAQILLGGGIVNTCLWAKGFKVGGSLVDRQYRKLALSYFKNKKIIMPVDLVVGGAKGESAKVVALDKKFKIIGSKTGIYDIGPKTIALYAKYIKKANTIVWNGAMGMFEVRPYQWGSNSVARLMASRSKGRAYGVAGGGETVEILKNIKHMDEVDLVSTGGGAMLEFLSGKKLPGVIAVAKK